jgi:succinyl-CoA synthetase alpha subunit
MNVFLSYASEDKLLIRKVLDQLKAKGVLSPREKVVDISAIAVPGSSMRRQVREAIENASKFVVVWNDTALTSDWVNYEIGMAEALGKPILVVVPKGETSRIPGNLKETQVIEMEEIK